MSSVDIQAMLNSGVKSAMRFSDLDGPHTKTIIYDHDEFIAEIKAMESSENKPPVYTQEMVDNGELPPVGVWCLVNIKGVQWVEGFSVACDMEDGIPVSVVRCGSSYYAFSIKCIRPLPQPTEREKAIAVIDDFLAVNLGVGDPDKFLAKKLYDLLYGDTND